MQSNKLTIIITIILPKEALRATVKSVMRNIHRNRKTIFLKRIYCNEAFKNDIKPVFICVSQGAFPIDREKHCTAPHSGGITASTISVTFFKMAKNYLKISRES